MVPISVPGAPPSSVYIPTKAMLSPATKPKSTEISLTVPVVNDVNNWAFSTSPGSEPEPLIVQPESVLEGLGSVLLYATSAMAGKLLAQSARASKQNIHTDFLFKFVSSAVLEPEYCHAIMRP